MIGVLVSGSGSNLQALLDEGLPVVAVASNVEGAPALERAAAAGPDTAVFPLERVPGPRRAGPRRSRTGSSTHGVRLVVCAGYMHLLTPAFLDRFPGRVVNVHPALLPGVPGRARRRGRAGGRRARDRRHRAPRRRGRRHRPRARAGGRARARRRHGRDAPRADPRGRAPAPARGRPGADRPRDPARAPLRVRQDRAARVRAGPARARRRARRERRHRARCSRTTASR